MWKFLFVLFGAVMISRAGNAVCPDGWTEYLGQVSRDQVRNVNGGCSEICGAGVTSLNTSSGYTFDLFRNKNTSPAIAVNSGGVVCWADLVPGQADGTLNVSVGENVYHANPNSGQFCPMVWTLSYNCGDGATGIPPESREFAYGELYTASYDVGTCKKTGYHLSDWKIDTSTRTPGKFYGWTYTTDKTMVAQWEANDYGFLIVCDNGTASNSYGAVKFNETVNLVETTCYSTSGQTFAGYRVLDAWGNDTGDVVSTETSFQWKWPGNILLQAIWE